MPRIIPACVAMALSVGELAMSIVAVESCDSSTFARPKSRTFTVPSGVIFTFAGFRSRWITPRSWAYSSASAICLAIGNNWSICSGGFTPPCGEVNSPLRAGGEDTAATEILSPSVWPSTSSITSARTPFDSSRP